MMEKNVAESIRWPQTDILLTTPKMLYRIMEHKWAKKDPVLPEFLVVDEADAIVKNR